MSKRDVIKQPSHYVEGRKYEPKDVIRDWGLNFNLGNAVKYIARAGRKDDIVQDLKKAQEYIQFEIDAIEAEREKAVKPKTPNHPNCRCSVHPVFAEMENGKGVSCGVIELELEKDFDPSQVAKMIINTIMEEEKAEEDEKIIPVTVEMLGDMKRVSYKSDEVEVPADVSTEDALAFLLAHFGETGEE